MSRQSIALGSLLKPLPLAIGLAIGCTATSLHAAESEAPVELDALTVTGQRSQPLGPDTGYVAKDSLIGCKTDTPLAEIPRSISVVTQEQMEDRQVLSVSDALKYTPGVQAGYFGEDNKQDWFIIRGFKQANFGLFQDSTRVYSSGFYSWQVDPYLLQRVEVQRGASSVLFGQSPPGGVINLVSKRPTESSFGEVGLQYGSYNRKQINFDVGGPLTDNDNVLFRVTGLVRESGTQVDDVDNDRMAIAPALTLNFSEDTSLTLLTSFQKDSGEPMLQFLPASGTLTYNPNGRIDTDTPIGDPSYERFEREQYTLGYEFKHRINDTWSLQQNLRYGHIDMDLRQLFFLGWVDESAGLLGRGLSYANGDADNLSVDNRVTGQWQSGRWENTLLLGADYQQLKVNDSSPDGYPRDTVPVNIYNPVNRDFTTPFALEDKRTEINQVGIYAQNQLKLDDRWVFLAGVRHDRAEFDFDNRTTGSGNEANDDEVTWNGGIAYLFDNGLTPYASYSQFFQPVTDVNTVTSEAYKPESGEQYELGLKYQPPGLDASFNAALFQLTQENVRKAVAGGASEQVGEVRVRGLELEANANLTRELSLVGSYTLLDAETTKTGTATAEKGKTPSQVSDRMASFWAHYDVQGGPLDGLGFGSGVRYVGASYGDNTESLKVPSYTIYDAVVSYDWQNTTLQLNANNLADKEYVATCDYYCWYGNRRNVVASLTYRW